MEKVELLGDILASSIQNLYTNQPNLSKFTYQTTEPAWSSAHHLANEIAKYISWLDCDLDVIKNELGNRRAGIVFHKRGASKNFLAIELRLKKSSHKGDIEKTKQYWISSYYNYTYGASILLDIENKTAEITLFYKDQEIPKPMIDYKHLSFNEVSQENFEEY